MTILIIGATGKVAAGVTRQLLAAKQPVRLLVRSEDKAKSTFSDQSASLDIVAGSFTDPVVLAKAFKDVSVAFLAIGTSPVQGAIEKSLIDAAREAKLPQLVRLSGFGSGPDANYSVAQLHGELDKHLLESGVPHTLLRPTFFDTNLLMSAPSIVAENCFYGCAPTGRISMIDPADVADAAAAIILRSELQNRAYEFTGPESLTFPEVAERMTAVLGRPIRYVALDEATIKAARAARGVPEFFIDVALGIDRGLESNAQDVVNSCFRKVTGRDPKTIDQFLTEHRAYFMPAAKSVN